MIDCWDEMVGLDGLGYSIVYYMSDMYRHNKKAVFGELASHIVSMVIQSLQTNIWDHFGKARRALND